MQAKRRVADWWSRIIALMSLVLSIGALGYTVVEHRVASTRSVLLEEFRAALGNETGRVDEALETVQSDVTAALVRLAAAESTALSDAQRQAQNQLANRQLDQQQPTNRPNADDLDPSNHQEKPPNFPELGQPRAQPKLVAKRITYRPRQQDEPRSLLLLENTGDRPAKIRHIRFQPKTTFEVKHQEDLNADAVLALGAATPLDFTFLPQHNRSDKPGRHGIYEHLLDHQVDASQPVSMTLSIQDGQHTGWGITGQLTIGYNGLEDLVVEDVSVLFVAPAS